MSERMAFLVARCVAAGFAFCATLKLPYNFYTLTRWMLFGVCCWGLIRKERFWPAYLAIGLVFNPVLPFHFARGIWFWLDVVAGSLLLASMAMDSRKT